MQGYSTIVSEIWEQITTQSKLNEAQGIVRGSTNTGYFTHILLQAGVGSFAGGITAGLVNAHKELCSSVSTFPKIIVVEPRGADCLFRSHKQGDGHIYGNNLKYFSKT